MDEEKTLSDKMSGRVRQPVDAGGKRVLNGRLLRSPVDRGRIISIELPNPPSGIVSIVGKVGAGKLKFGGISIPILSERNILWKGQPILAAAGPDREELEDWLSGIHLNIKTPDEAPDPLVTEKIIVKGSTGEAFSKAFQVIEEIVEIPSAPALSESRTVSCIKEGNSFTIHAATSWPGAIIKNVARTLKTDKKNIRVKSYAVSSGSNREIWLPAVEACRAALLSAKAKRSVRITSSPTESRIYGPGLPGADFHIRGAIDSEGRTTALDVEFTIHTGAIFPMENEFFERVVLGLFSIYPCRNYSIRGKISRGSHPPSAFGPAAGFELGFLAGELYASRVAEYSLSPPGGWRRESFPVHGQSLGPGIVLPKDFPMKDLLNKGLAVSDFERKSASYEQTRLGRHNLVSIPEFYRGIGLSCAWFGNGFLTSPKELGSASSSLTLAKDGELIIDMPSSSPGRILQKIWSEISGGILGIDSKSISFSEGLIQMNQEPGPSILGRNVSIYTKLIELAGNDLAKRRFRDALPISVTRSRRRSGSRSWNNELLEGTPFETISWGVGIVEIAISTITFEVKPIQIWMIIDGGNLLMPGFAKAAVESTAEEALQWCSCQPERKELPLIDIQFHENSSRRQAKDVSSLPWLLLPAAFLQAVRQASGISVSRIPVSPELLRTGGMTH